MFENQMLPYVDGSTPSAKPSESALCQMLLKSVSKDKKFVLEASQRVLAVCAETLEPVEMAYKMLAYCKHKCALPMLLAPAVFLLSVTPAKPKHRSHMHAQLPSMCATAPCGCSCQLGSLSLNL